MLKRLANYWFVPLFLAIAGIALANSSLTGDGYEYVLSMHALSEHGTLEVTQADIASLHRTAGKVPFYAVTLGDLMPYLAEHLRAPEKTPAFTYTITPNDAGRFYGIHFGLYSLLALPFYVLLKPFGGYPHYALTLLNLSFCVGAFLYLRRAMAQQASLAMLLFLLAGATFYLSWTGPEVLTASCMLICCLATLRGRPGLAILFAGLTASQNPPIFLMIPFAVAYRLLIVRYPRLQWPDSVAAGLSRRELLLGAAGGRAGAGAIRVLPAHLRHAQRDRARFQRHQLHHRRPPVLAVLRPEPGHDHRDPRRRTGPGDLPVYLAARGARPVVDRVRAAVRGYRPDGPARPEHRQLEFGRRGHDALQLLAGHAAAGAGPAGGEAVAAACRHGPVLAGAALQALLLTSTGLLGGKTLYSEHSLPARWMLAHFPRLYNPEAEIFHARTGKAVILPLPKDSVSVFRADGEPSKIMRHRSNRGASGGLCAAGEQLVGQHVRAVSREWEYLHAPFTCVAPAP